MTTKKFNSSRRRLVLGATGLAALGAAAVLRPRDKGQNHSSYFEKMSAALRNAHFAKPTLVIDRSVLLKNIETLNGHINGRFDYRVVGKSLPSIPLLQLVMKEADTNRVMMFHQPFLSEVTAKMPAADVLVGKPMPVAAAENFYRGYGPESSFDAERQLQWLIDTPARLHQYQQLAKSRSIKLQVNIELDVGLHRGGVAINEELSAMLLLIDGDPNLSFAGFMGYEPHIAKVPGNKLKLRDKAMTVYSDKLAIAEQVLGKSLSDLTLNAGGSPTYQYYNEGRFPQNELAAGSCLVKPTDFDIPSLSDHMPAGFIASPILKTSKGTHVPGVAGLGKAMEWWNPNRAQTFFSYGGYWKSVPESPKGLVNNPLLGRSTNQEMYNGSNRISLAVDDWMFWRPTQSEFVFLQFGDIAVYDNGEIVDTWPTFDVNKA
ncbi:MAG: DSD1 family PLP-dependent enzyme [Pseudomonadales bacterium]